MFIAKHDQVAWPSVKCRKPLTSVSFDKRGNPNFKLKIKNEKLKIIFESSVFKVIKAAGHGVTKFVYQTKRQKTNN